MSREPEHPSDWQDFVRVAYRGLLHREARDDELRRHAASLRDGTARPVDLLRTLLHGDERRGARLWTGYHHDEDERVKAFRTPAVDALSHRLETERPLSREDFDRLWQVRFHQELGQGVPEQRLRAYGEMHRRRFWDTVNSMAILLEGQPAPRVLDFGITAFLVFYKRLFPHLELVTAERPVDPAMLEFFQRASAEAGATTHVSVDLGEPSFLTDEVERAFGTFDLIIFTEVIEHVPVHPVHILRGLVRLLRPGGQVYLSTPNFFSGTNLWKISRRIHPQQVFPLQGNANAALHYRELGMPELLEFIAEAGGRPTSFHFSDCWDDQVYEPPDQRGNMVVTFTRT